jgi:hypothetical protein
MSEYDIFLSVTVSVISGVGAILGGWMLIPFISYYQEYILIKYNQDLDGGVLRRGYFAAAIAIILGLFYIFRVFYIVSNHKDFDSGDWMLSDMFTGIDMFMSSHFFLSLYRERRRIEKLVADKNDSLLSETF